MVVVLLSCFPLWRGKLLLIKSVMAGLCCSSNGTWQWAWHVSCQGQVFKHTTLKSLLCVCVCVCEWLILLPPMQWKKEGTRSSLQKFLERADGEIFSEAVVTSLTICFSINFRCIYFLFTVLLTVHNPVCRCSHTAHTQLLGRGQGEVVSMSLVDVQKLSK